MVKKEIGAPRGEGGGLLPTTFTALSPLRPQSPKGPCSIKTLCNNSALVLNLNLKTFGDLRSEPVFWVVYLWKGEGAKRLRHICKDSGRRRHQSSESERKQPGKLRQGTGLQLRGRLTLHRTRLPSPHLSSQALQRIPEL